MIEQRNYPTKNAISGLPMILECGNLCTMSIDRINNDQGYSVDNVHLVCKWVNLGRGSHSIQEMREVLGAIIQYPSPDLVLPEVQ